MTREYTAHSAGHDESLPYTLYLLGNSLRSLTMWDPHASPRNDMLLCIWVEPHVMHYHTSVHCGHVTPHGDTEPCWGNGMFPNGTKLLPKSILTNHHVLCRSPKGKYHRKCSKCYPWFETLKMTNSRQQPHLPRTNELIASELYNWRNCPACRTYLIATRFWVVVICPIIKCLTVLEFSFILFDLCLFITIFNFILNYVPIVTFWIFTYHKIWILLIIFCFIWNYRIIYFLTCLEVFWSVVS